MTIQQDIFGGSETSLAAYGKYETFSYSDALEQADMATSHVSAFTATYTILNHIPNTASGFSATVFKSSDGQLTVAIRGTEGVNGDDLHADNHITQYGAAYNQIVDMYNWWKQVSITAGTELDQ